MLFEDNCKTVEKVKKSWVKVYEFDRLDFDGRFTKEMMEKVVEILNRHSKEIFPAKLRGKKIYYELSDYAKSNLRYQIEEVYIDGVAVAVMHWE